MIRTNGSITTESLKVDAVKFYYEDFADEGKATVCLLIKGNEVVARGVAYCSPSDQFIKRVGRNMAQGRAIKALFHKQSFYPIAMGYHQIMNLPTHCYIQQKAEYQPRLNEKEQAIVRKGKWLE